MADSLDARKWRVLRAVIRDYIRTGLPVGSERLTRKYRLDLSSATVRNTMACLEEMGYLEQPHVSSGRSPTDRAFRYYVDALMDPKPLDRNVQKLIRDRFQEAVQDVGGIMRETSRILSGISHCAGVVSFPRISQTVFERIDFYRLDEDHVLIVLISQTGVLYHRILRALPGVSQEELRRAADYLNRRIRGLSLAAARQRILEQMEKDRVRYRRILEKFWNAGVWNLEGERTEVYIDGQSNILDYPEFSEDVKKMKGLLRAFEQKEALLQLLNQAVEGEGTRIYIGQETQWDDMAECSLIMSNYCRDGVPLGALGIIGPKRMDYSWVIPLVEFAAKAVGERLEKIGG